MTSSLTFQGLMTTFVRLFALFFTGIVSGLAVAEEPSVAAEQSPQESSKVPYRGTTISYGHSATALTFAPAAEPYYNPTEAHRLGLMPEWHFTSDLFARARFSLTQELTISDDTNTRHEVELSDLWLDAVYGGYREEVTGLRFSGDVRVTLPTSKQSRAMTRLFTLGPSLKLSRKFEVLSGLTLAYGARFTFRFDRMATSQNEGPSIAACNINTCPDLFSTGRRNAQFDLLHGPTIVFDPHPRVSISAAFTMQRGWLRPLATPQAEFANAQGLQVPDINTRDGFGFSLGATWQTWDVVGFTLEAFTATPQLGPNGLYKFPLFNRNTVVSLDATFDLEAAVASFSPKEKK